MDVDRKSFVPIYEQLKRCLEEEITAGVRKCGEQLPPEPELALHYNISRKTLRHSLSDLASEGFLVRRRGKGTFVADIKKVLPEVDNNSLGVLVPSITYFFPEVVRGIEEVARRNGYTITLSTTDDDPHKEMEYLGGLITKNHITNFIITPSKYGSDFSVYPELRKKGATFVFIDRYFDKLGKGADYVIQDNREGIRKAVNYLKELGHKRIMLMGRAEGCREHYILKERLISFKDAFPTGELKARGHQKSIVIVNSFVGDDRKRTKNCLKKVKPTAVVALSDFDAREIVDIVFEMGLNIPEDISLVGYDESNTGRIFNPPLTTISVPKYEMGKEAAKILLNRIKRGGEARKQPVHKVLKPQLVVRDTTARRAY